MPTPVLEVHHVGEAAAARGAELARRLERRAQAFPDPEARPAFWERFGKSCLRRILASECGPLARKLRAGPVTWLRGLPVDADPGPAPYSGHAPTEPLTATLMKIFGIIGLIEAKACAFLDENDGRLVRNVVAVPAARQQASSQGCAELPWHMDGAYRPFRPGPGALAPPPRWLVFGVIKDGRSVPITVAPLSAALERLSPAARAALELREYAVTTPDSVSRRRCFAPLSVLERDADGNFVSRYNRGHCRGLSRSAARALAELDDVLGDQSLHLALPVVAGDLVLIDNWRCLHRRSAYTPAWDGNDRWFVRVYASALPLRPNDRRLC